MSSEILDIEFLHAHLDYRFRELREQRQDDLPIFALEHGLESEDLEDLEATVREHVASNLHDENAWLPWIVYATEIGYGFSGQVYWKPFREKIPKWKKYGTRRYLKGRFQQFAEEYGGVQPSGAWATYNSIISWPITHAILPEDLRSHLIEILYSGREMLEGRNWHDPSPVRLGEQIRLQARSRSHVSKRFIDFTQQEKLVGQIAKALLFSKDEAAQPLIDESALKRIIEGLEEEKRILLDEASRSARRGKAGRGSTRRGTPADNISSLSASLLLHPTGENEYIPIVRLPTLKPLLEGGEEFEEALLHCNVTVVGGQRSNLPPRTLIESPTEVRLEDWTLPTDSFIGFDGEYSKVARAINSRILKVQEGPWLFKIRKDGTARNIRSRGARPGESYVVVGSESDFNGFDLGTSITIHSTDITGCHLNLGDPLSEEEEAELRKLNGIEVKGDIDVWPAGTVPFEYDGQGAITWLSTDIPMLGVHSNLAVNQYRVAVETGESVSMDAPEEGPVFLKLSGLGVGSHTLSVSAEARNGTSTEEIVAEVRRPTEDRTENSKIWPLYVRATPPVAGLEDLWDGDISIEALGPESHMVKVTLELHSQDSFEPLASVSERCSLPLTEADWDELFQSNCLKTTGLTEHFDEAYKAKVSIDGGIIGSEELSFERRRTLLRWKLESKAGHRTIHLVDDTSETEGKTEAYRYDTEAPLERDQRLVRRREETYEIKSCGGLWHAEAGEFSTSRIVPPLTQGSTSEQVEIEREKEAVIHAVETAGLWKSAGAPERESVLLKKEVLDRLQDSMVRTLCGEDWMIREEKWLASPTDETRSRLQELVDMRKGAENPVRKALSTREPCPDRGDLGSWIDRNNWIQPQTSDNISEGMVNLNDLTGLNYTTMAEIAIDMMSDIGNATRWEVLEDGIEELIRTQELAQAARAVVLAQRIYEGNQN